MAKENYNITGMSCAACANRIEKAVKNLPGINKVNINLSTAKMAVEYEHYDTNSETIIEKVKEAGYGADIIRSSEKVFLQIKGITCANCVKTIETALKKHPGIYSANINVMTNRARVEYDGKLVSITLLKEIIRNAGYEVENFQKLPNAAQADETSKNRQLAARNRLIVAIVFAALLMIISMGTSFGLNLPTFINPEIYPINFGVLQIVLLIPVVYLGRDFYRKGYKMLWKRSPNMDSLIALGTSAAIVYSIYLFVLIVIAYLNGSSEYTYHLYFDTASTILTLIMLGKYLESIAKGKTSTALKELLQLTPSKAILLKDDKQIEIDVEDIEINNVLVVRHGDKIPIDGKIIEGITAIDEAMITGESLPVQKQKGDDVFGATINKTGKIEIQATRVGEDTLLAKIIRLVEEAESTKAPIARLADIISSYFVQVIIVLALITALIWLSLGYGLTFSLSRMITVLVISCPCALGLATPTSIVVGMGRSAKMGVLFKNGEALENAHKIKTIVFDKTGTVTSGKPIVTDIFGFTTSEAEILQLTASIEKNSNHPLAQAILAETEERKLGLLKTEAVAEFPGKGLQATINNKTYYIGSLAFLNENGIAPAKDDDIEQISKSGKSLIYLGTDKTLIGMIAVSDKIKENAKTIIAEIKKMGIRTYLLTGDKKDTALHVAKQIGIDEVLAEVLPEDKAETIRNLKGTETDGVAMVGDGINDAIALSEADIGISLGSASDIAIESADIILVKNNLQDLLNMLRLSRLTITNIKQNLFWAFAYNVLGIPFAAGLVYAFGGPLLNPMIAAAAMSFSSVTVVLNALRLKRMKIKKGYS